MSDDDGTCEYVLDPDDPETWDGEERDECYVEEEVLNEDGIWTCPHYIEDGEDLCIFHMPVEKKDDEKVVDAFLEVVDNSTDFDSDPQKRKPQFLGAKFGSLELGEEIKSIVVDPRLSCAKFEKSTDWSGIKFEDNVFFSGAKFEQEADFSNSMFKAVAQFISVEFNKGADFKSTDFRENADFTKADLGFNRLEAESHNYPEIGDRDIEDIEKYPLELYVEPGFHKTRFVDADLTGAIFTDANLRSVNFESAIMNRVRLFGADLRIALLYGAVLGNVQIDEETKFLGDPFVLSLSYPQVSVPPYRVCAYNSY